MEIIETIFKEWEERKIPKLIKRDLSMGDLLKGPGKIIAFTGFRRVGKTSIMLNLINELSKEACFYINFEDERIPSDSKFLSELYKGIKRRPWIKYLFVDEIQEMPAWSKWLRRINEEGRVRVIASGSSSKLSSREIPTELRGQAIEISVRPLSYKEYRRFRENGDLGEYVEYGGMPEVVLSGLAEKDMILQSYYNTVVRRDIIERYDIRNEEALKTLLRLLLESTKYTLTKSYNTLKSLGYVLGKETASNYHSHIESSYFSCSLPAFSGKLKDSMQAPRKLYFVDNGFLRLSSKFSRDAGRKYESAVFQELLRRKKSNEDLYYWKDYQQHEVDFVIKKGTRVKRLIQVCVDPNDPETKRREIRSLIKASKETACNELIVITKSYEAKEVCDWRGEQRSVKFMTLERFLMS